MAKEKSKSKQYIYITKASNEETSCKIGKTDNLERRLKEYNNMTGQSIDITFQYLFACEVKDMKQVENDIKKEFPEFRQKKNKEMYFLNDILLEKYISFIKGHPLFVKEEFIRINKKQVIVKYEKRITPSLKDRGLTYKKVMLKSTKSKK